MENASKALIIAGAILLSIIIISLGLVVVNNVKDSISGNNLSAEQKQAINVKFEAYEGSNITGMQVNNLIQEVIQYNTEAMRDSTGAYMGIAFPTASRLDTDFYIGVHANVGNKTIQQISYATMSWIESDFGNRYTTTQNNTYDFVNRVATSKTYKVSIYARRDGIVSHILVVPNK